MRETIEFVINHAVFSDPDLSNATAYPEAAHTGIEDPGPAIMHRREHMSYDLAGHPIQPSEHEIAPLPSMYLRWGAEPDEDPPEPRSDVTCQSWSCGAGGCIFLYLKAASVLGDVDGRYLQAARNCGEEIWAHGITREGPGLSCGISGNVYAFLALARIEHEKTKSQRWLRRAQYFAAFASNTQEELPLSMRRKSFAYSRTDWFDPHVPECLIEGFGGAALMLLDLENPSDASFPLFEPTNWKKTFPSSVK